MFVTNSAHEASLREFDAQKTSRLVFPSRQSESVNSGKPPESKFDYQNIVKNSKRKLKKIIRWNVHDK